MRTMMLPIEMIAKFDGSGNPTPLRFKVPEATGIFKVDRIIQKEEEKLAGNRMFIFRCSSLIHDTEKIYELKYEISTCRWYIYKM